MSVHIKLMQARIKLQGMELKKSGENKFAGYKYFELGDFLPQTQQIFYDLKLCSIVSFKPDFASLDIIDTEDGTMITITSPMAEAQLKGAHPIQNLGAVESYQRRYLWMAAMEIVEHDILDASTGSEPPPKPKVEPKPPVKPSLPPNDEFGGKDEPWLVSIKLDIKDDLPAWIDVMLASFRLQLTHTKTLADVMTLWRVNKQKLDTLKEQALDDYEALLQDFSKRKAFFKDAK